MAIKRVVGLSGGKDGQATLIWACEKFGPEKVTAVFCDVKWDHEITYKHIDYLIEQLGCEFVNLTSHKFDGMVGMVDLKKRFPSTTRRFCTTHLKVEPMIDYILSLDSHVIIYQGIRADESAERSLMESQCAYFKYYFEPYETNSKIVTRFSAMPKLNKVQAAKLEKAKVRLAKGKEDAKFHTYRKADVFAFCAQYADDVERPFFNATANEVIYYSLNKGFSINPLYFLGVSRIGCFPCVMATIEEMDIIRLNYPEVIEKIRDAERKTGSSFFGPGYIPARYHTGKVMTKKGLKTFPYIDDVIRYLQDRKATGDLFANDPEVNGCKSVYAICE